MTEHGGGRDSGAGDWFKPSENRYRTQSEYQDPLEGEEAEESAETVFPDSGGYAGLSASRPALVEPYPEALGGPPSGASATSNSISYPGAGLSAYQPLTRAPGEPDLPSVAASAEVPLPSEDSGEGPTGRMDSWAASAAAGEEALPGTGYTGQDRASDTWRHDDPLDGRRGTAAWDADAPSGGADERGRDTWGQDSPAEGPGERAGDSWDDTPADRAGARNQDAWRDGAPGAGLGDNDREAWAPARDSDAWTPDPAGDARPWDDELDGGSGPAARTDAPAAWDPEGVSGTATWDADAPSGGADERGRDTWGQDSPAEGPGERA
ncbi:hypothetical protein ACFWTE_21095, partial [Nocardiopsis sp. NPDC058631]|uniref:hypothetical protein n=1 Tax=Nocardiopsis sp. NPDC058631 TaxID=3346566 RepID=UPI00364E6503